MKEFIPQIINGALYVEASPIGKRTITACPDHIRRGYRLTTHLGLESIFFIGTANIPGSPSDSFLCDGKIFFSTSDSLTDYLHEAAHIITAPYSRRKRLNVGLNEWDYEQTRSGQEEILCCYVHQYLMEIVGISPGTREETRKDYSFKINAGLMAYKGRRFIRVSRKDFHKKIKTFST